jgi:hypothetical protein
MSYYNTPSSRFSKSTKDESAKDPLFEDIPGKTWVSVKN